MAVDFVVHGTEGLAGPWAAAARPGWGSASSGPAADTPRTRRRTYTCSWAMKPRSRPSALRWTGCPTTLRRRSCWKSPVLSTTGRCAGPTAPPSPGCTAATAFPTAKHWSTPSGRWTSLPGRVSAFVHGNADMVKALRRYLFVEQRVDRRQVSISGYWRTGHTEDRWQATRGQFNAAMEAEETVLS